MTRSIQIICSSLEELDQAITAENAASLDEIFQSFSNMKVCIPMKVNPCFKFVFFLLKTDKPYESTMQQ